MDVANNTLRAYLSALLRDQLDTWAERQPQVVARPGLDLPLMGLIYLLAPQLWLSTVGLVADSRRFITTLLLGWAASVVLIVLYRHHWSHDLRAAALVAPALALFAFTTAALPSVFTGRGPSPCSAMPPLAVAGAVTGVGSGPEATLPREHDGLGTRPHAELVEYV